MKIRIVKIFTGCLIALAMLAGIIYYYFYATANFRTVVEGRIYRSAQLSSEKLQKMISDKKLRTVINLRGIDKGKKWYKVEKKIMVMNGVQYDSFNFDAHKLPYITELDGLITALKTAPRPLLLHCKGGADRSGMASALALAIEKNASLSDLKRQFSIFYGVIPFTGSVGPLFFKQYEHWLKKTGKTHNWDALSYWIKTVYIDSRGNIQFSVDIASGIEFKANGVEEIRAVTLQPPPKTFSIQGWAFNRRKNTNIDVLYLILSNHIQKRVEFGISRPDVAEVYKLSKEAFPDFKVGWAANFDGSALPNGCHDIFLKVGAQGEKPHRIVTNCRLCIEKVPMVPHSKNE